MASVSIRCSPSANLAAALQHRKRRLQAVDGVSFDLPPEKWWRSSASRVRARASPRRR